MKKEGIIFSLLFLISIISFSGVLAANSTSEMADNAYSCLIDNIDDQTCDELSLTEKIFSVLSVGKCRSELIEESSDDQECWPDGRCDIKTTAQAILALDRTGRDTTAAQDWLLEQKDVSRDLVWYLEIDSQNVTSCDITYRTNEYTTIINQDKTIENDAGSCLTVDEEYGGYWLKIDASCYDEEFEISCNNSFLSTMLFKEEDSDTLNVLEEFHSAPEEGTTFEKITSFCFAGRNGCDYEGSLWATVVLDKLDRDVSSYIPYLISGEEENREYFPYPFLYLLTDYIEHKTSILERQINDQFWKEANDRYYDTALALLPFQGQDNLYEKENTIDWLMDIQQDDGCWDGGNIRSNSFILYSLFPKSGLDIFGDDDEDSISYDNDCEASGYYCMSGVSCETSNLLSDYDCSGFYKCCSVPKEETSCYDLGGEICSGTEYCKSGNKQITDDLSWDETCCVGGTCEKEIASDSDEELSECEENFGVCESFSCDSGYSESGSYECLSSGDICCIRDSNQNKSSWWIWVLFILIVLVVIGIIYKDKLKEIWAKFEAKRKMGGGNQGSQRPGMPPRSPPQYQRRLPMRPPMQRKILPPTQRPPMRSKPKSPEELDEVLRKLKDMGK